MSTASGVRSTTAPGIVGGWSGSREGMLCMSLASQPASVVLEPASYGDAGGSSDQPLVFTRAGLSAARQGTYGSVSADGPYDHYTPGGKGVVTWGSTEWADQYCWLIDTERPGHCPVLARSHDPGPWYRYDMSTAEPPPCPRRCRFPAVRHRAVRPRATFVPESAGRPL